MSNIEISVATSFKPFITDEMTKFISKLDNSEIKYRVCACEAGFYKTKQEYIESTKYGPLGPCGSTGCNTKDNRPIGDPRYFTLNFNFKVNNDHLENIKSLLELMTTSVGGRDNTYKHYTIREIDKYNENKYGLVKTELFDKVYKYFHDYYNISVEKFIGYGSEADHRYSGAEWILTSGDCCNPDLAVEELYNEENKNSYIMVYDANVLQSTGYSRIYLSILNKDLTDGNAKIISEILE